MSHNRAEHNGGVLTGSAELKLSVSLMSKNALKYDSPDSYDDGGLAGAAGLGEGPDRSNSLNSIEINYPPNVPKQNI